jgi:hypothetical protein
MVGDSGSRVTVAVEIGGRGRGRGQGSRLGLLGAASAGNSSDLRV